MAQIPTLEVFYDGGCPICRWEVRYYEHLDKRRNIKWTDIEGLLDMDLPRLKTRQDLLGKFHVRELQNPTKDWHIGVDAFAQIWRTLPHFKNFAFLFQLPIIRQFLMLGYRLFLKWQDWHRTHRRESTLP